MAKKQQEPRVDTTIADIEKPKKAQTPEDRKHIFKDEDEEKFATWLMGKALNHPVVTAHHGKWKELIEWREGNQYSAWSQSDNKVAPVSLVTRKKRLVINIMKPLAETIEGKINTYFHVIGIPNSDETSDIKGAEVATRWVEYNDYINEREQMMEDMKYDLVTIGNTCERWFWDRNMYGNVAIKKKDGNIMDTHSEEGDVRGETIPIFNVRLDPVANNPEKARWIIEFKEIPIDDLKSAYGLGDVFVDTLKEGQSDQKYAGMNVNLEEVDKEEETLVIGLYHSIPSNKYPKGRKIVVCNDKVIWGDVNKNPKSQLGYFFNFYMKNHYSLVGKGPLYYVQYIQREFNRCVSLISEHIEAWRPKMSVGKGALTRAHSMTVDNFEIVEVDYAKGEPKPIHMPELSQNVLSFRDFLLSSIDRVSNIHEVSYSRLPQYASRAPASLYSMMLEQENVKLSPMVKGINKTLVRTAKYRLELMDQHYKHPRLVKVFGKNKAAIIHYWDAKDLSKAFDVRLEVGVSLNMSSSVQQQLLLDLWEKGILQGKQSELIIKSLELGTIEQDIRSELADENRAVRENQSFIDGNWNKEKGKGKVFSLMHDDHELHLETHTNLQKTEEAEAFDEETWQALEAHIDEHFFWKQFAMKFAMMQQQQTAAGGTGTPASPDMGGSPMGMPGEGQAVEEGMPTEEPAAPM